VGKGSRNRAVLAVLLVEEKQPAARRDHGCLEGPENYRGLLGQNPRPFCSLDREGKLVDAPLELHEAAEDHLRAGATWLLVFRGPRGLLCGGQKRASRFGHTATEAPRKGLQGK